jgi:SAM-dependent methyltransferase
MKTRQMQAREDPIVAETKEIRRLEDGRLAYYKTRTDAQFWDEHWKTNLTKEAFLRYQEGYLSFFEKPFEKYLPRTGRILEAGCGIGQYVMALRSRGYDCEGVDWSEQTVNTVIELFPDLPVRKEDVTRLDVPGGHYQGYISLGVVEHRQAGPQPFLAEAARVLSAGGAMLISVPYFHSLRKLKASLGLYGGSTQGLDFYQYAFTTREMEEILRGSGFHVIERYPYDLYKSLKDEIPFLRTILEMPVIGWRLLTFLKKWEWGRRYWGHMILYVCIKV